MPSQAARTDPRFPILERCLWANHAAIAPWPSPVADAVREFADENSRLGALGYRNWMARETELRVKSARFINAESGDDIAFVKNTTEGICMTAWGLPLQAGDNIVIPSGEFPSNRLPWLAQQARGAELREVDIRSSEDAEAALLDAIDARTRVLSVSAVQYDDGFRLNLERLGTERPADVFFFVDAIQQMGALPLDVHACHIDALAADAHKWLLGPEGIAVFYVSGNARTQLELTQRGWHATDDPFDFSNPDQPPSDSARRYEPGSPNSIGQAALDASLTLLMETGMEKVGSMILDNTDRLLRALCPRMDLEIVTRTEPERRSGIVSFRPTARSIKDVFRDLKRRNVVAALRGPAIRISPHYYQSGETLDILIAAIEDALAE